MRSESSGNTLLITFYDDAGERSMMWRVTGRQLTAWSLPTAKHSTVTDSFDEGL